MTILLRAFFNLLRKLDNAI